MFHRLFLFFLLLLCVSPLRAQWPDSELAQGEAAWKRDDYQSAQMHFDRAIRTSHGNANIDAPAFHGRGVAKLQLHEWQGAKDDLTRAVQLDPTNAGAFAMRGMARKGLGDYDGLLLDAREAARLNPKDFTDFEDDAKSTVLWRRMMMVFLGLGGIVLCLGAYAMSRPLIRLLRAEGDARRASR